MMLATLASSAAQTPADTQPKITPEMRAKLADLRTRIQSSVGQVVLAMANLPRHRNQTLGDLSHLVLEPLLRDRLAIATARPKDEGEAESNFGESLAGIAIWASVDDAVDAKIREQIKDYGDSADCHRILLTDALLGDSEYTVLAFAITVEGTRNSVSPIEET